jgi:hypothetical protein
MTDKAPVPTLHDASLPDYVREAHERSLEEGAGVGPSLAHFRATGEMPFATTAANRNRKPRGTSLPEPGAADAVLRLSIEFQAEHPDTGSASPRHVRQTDVAASLAGLAVEKGMRAAGESAKQITVTTLARQARRARRLRKDPTYKRGA